MVMAAKVPAAAAQAWAGVLPDFSASPKAEANRPCMLLSLLGAAEKARAKWTAALLCVFCHRQKRRANRPATNSAALPAVT
jgi:hypothetical protein